MFSLECFSCGTKSLYMMDAGRPLTWLHKCLSTFTLRFRKSHKYSRSTDRAPATPPLALALHLPEVALLEALELALLLEEDF